MQLPIIATFKILPLALSLLLTKGDNYHHHHVIVKRFSKKTVVFPKMPLPTTIHEMLVSEEEDSLHHYDDRTQEPADDDIHVIFGGFDTVIYDFHDRRLPSVYTINEATGMKSIHVPSMETSFIVGVDHDDYTRGNDLVIMIE